MDMPSDNQVRLVSSAITSLTDGLVVFDDQAQMRFFNYAAQELLGLTAEEWATCDAPTWVERLAVRSTAPNTVRARLLAVLEARAAVPSVELELEVAPESSRIVAARCFRIRDGATELGVGVLLRDVTRERTADAMKSQLLATVSHELRTPLASIKGFATTLLRQDVQWDEATQHDFLRIIEEDADRLTEIIDNLLDMSQIEAGALRIAKEPAQLRQLIRDVTDEMRMRTEAHYFVVDLPADLPRVQIDPRRIRQVLTNLIGNAIKYAKKGQITVACEVEDDHVTVSVSDQGEGIPPEYRGKIFERFFQVDNSSTRRVGGSGLGLAISRSIVEAHDGKIWVESTAGQGSTFRFTLPRAHKDGNE